MKKTAKFLALVTIGLIAFSASAQFGVRVGLGVSSWSYKDNDVNASQQLFEPGFAFHTGPAVEIDFSDNVALDLALMFSQKSFNADLDEFYKIKTSFVELPVNVKVYVVDLGNTARLYALGGGYVGYMFSAKSNGTKVDVGNKDGDFYKPFDAGFNFGAGAQLFESLNVDISGGIGIANLSNDLTNGLTSRLNVVRLTVTYQFGQ